MTTMVADVATTETTATTGTKEVTMDMMMTTTESKGKERTRTEPKERYGQRCAATTKSHRSAE